MRKIVSLLSMLMVLSSLTFAQTRSISGKVTDAKGNPVPAASIKKSKGEGAVAADQDGNFKITDFIGEGVSLIMTQRNDFNAILDQKGVDGFLNFLSDKVKELKSKKL